MGGWAEDQTTVLMGLPFGEMTCFQKSSRMARLPSWLLEVCRKMGFIEQTFHWKKKFQGRGWPRCEL